MTLKHVSNATLSLSIKLVLDRCKQTASLFYRLKKNLMSVAAVFMAWPKDSV